MIINTIPATDCTPQTIVIGRRGTYDTMQIAFDLSYLIENYGSGTAVLAVKRSQDESAYPAVVTQEDNTLTWTVSETDTYYVGSGECQLMWYVDGGLAKTIIYPIVVMRDILSTTEEPPDGYENWIEHLTELGAETQQNAQNAAQSASDAEDAKDDAVTAKEAAEAAQEAAETAVTHYPIIQNNYWMVWDSSTQQYVSTGIQAEGEDGYSPEVTITTITGGHRVTITDKDHPTGQSFDVLDGQGGGGGTSDYTELSNKPKINNVELNGNKTAHDLGLAAQTDIPTVPVQSVNGKTGAVVLDSGDIGFDSTETYSSGTAGAELTALSRHLSDLQPTATASDVGKALIVKTVDAQTGKPTEYKYGEATVWDAATVSLLDAIGNSLIYKDEYGGQYFSSLITLLRSRIQTNTYTITIALGHYVADNDITSIYEGLPYVCTLTPTQGFQFTSVTVTMGGTAVIPTENYDGTYTINITSVMGDISISAETEGAIGNIIFRTQNVVCDGTQPPIETGLMFGTDEANGVTSDWTLMITAKSTATGMAWYKRPFTTGTTGSYWEDNEPTSSALKVIGYTTVALNPLRNGFVSCVLTHVANEVTKLTAYYIDKDSGEIVSQICDAPNITQQLNNTRFGSQMYIGAAADGSSAFIGEIKDAVIYDVVADSATINNYLLGGNS